VADLLECLIQIKALGHSISRLERFVAGAPPAARDAVGAVLQRLLEAEGAYGRAGLGAAAAFPECQAAGRLAQFVALRRAHLVVLERLSAEELGRIVDWPGRPGTSVADLVAMMLAHDTERIGEIQRLGR
jgi:hypothetical protein